MAQLETWDYLDKHVDSTINERSYFSPAKTVIYVAPPKADGSTANAAGDFYPIGVVQGFSFAEQRQVDQIFEIGSDIPYVIPGRTFGQINISRMLINGRDLANVLSSDAAAKGGPIAEDSLVRSLKDINKPFDILFVVYGFKDGSNTEYEKKYDRIYRNCWITARNESIAANQAIVAENVTIVYQYVSNASITA